MAQDSITAPTMGIPVITEIDMGAQPIGMTVQGAPTVHEGAPPTGMMGPEAQPDGGGARRRGIMARVTSADIGEARRTGAAAPEVRLDGVAAQPLGAADRGRGTAPVVARVRGDVERPALVREKRILLRKHVPAFGLSGRWQIRTVVRRVAF